ncbi:MAG TPA: hypothetical protein ENK09_03245 [Nitrospirae bacterium]|nr:hypothetical protein [Nitrospirota bacterium]
MVRELKGFFYFLILVVAIVGLLKLMNLISGNLHKGYLGEFKSYEEVERVLNIKEIFRPAYLPQNMLWPPAHIFAQSSPYVTIISEYSDKDSGEIALLIIQTEGRAYYRRKELELVEVKEKTSYSINNVKGELEVGTCGDGSPCSRLSWQADRYRLVIALKAPPFELLRIAESISK